MKAHLLNSENTSDQPAGTLTQLESELASLRAQRDYHDQLLHHYNQWLKRAGSDKRSSERDCGRIFKYTFLFLCLCASVGACIYVATAIYPQFLQEKKKDIDLLKQTHFNDHNQTLSCATTFLPDDKTCVRGSFAAIAAECVDLCNALKNDADHLAGSLYGMAASGITAAAILAYTIYACCCKADNRLDRPLSYYLASTELPFIMEEKNVAISPREMITTGRENPLLESAIQMEVKDIKKADQEIKQQMISLTKRIKKMKKSEAVLPTASRDPEAGPMIEIGTFKK